ncbi:unnamed protein product [Lactuca virosa]|uniref:Glucose-6-phosphate 1-epimerase n=1 Tax=Lactuca virosa TaxID=75947 RepID=A0AAU9NSS6_9ASTR|nr:unnamed protein product [Lactuca virosa]
MGTTTPVLHPDIRRGNQDQFGIIKLKQISQRIDFINRVYLRTPTKIAITDHEKKRTIVIRKDGLPDAGVWNPWDKKAKAMPDFGDDEYKHMLCVEAATVEYPITLKLGEEWKRRQQLLVVTSSYCSGKLDPHIVC